MTAEQGEYLAAFLAAGFAVFRAVRSRITLAEAAEMLVSTVSWLLTRKKETPVAIDTAALKPDPRLITINVKGVKELAELGDALVHFLDDVADGKSPMAAAVEHFGEIQSGLDGATKIDDDWRDFPEESINTAGVILARVQTAVRKLAARGRTAAPAKVVSQS